MVDQKEAYTFQKRGIFYFSKRVPSDLRELYKVGRLTYSLKTKCPKTAEKQVRDALHKLELYWNKVRMHKEFPCSQFLASATNNQSNDLSIKFTEAVDLYLDLKGKNKADLAPITTFISPLVRPLQITFFFFGVILECQIAASNPKNFLNFFSNSPVSPISGNKINDCFPWCMIFSIALK